MALVDVIIPVFNTPLEYVAEALTSLQAQTFPRWQAWIVDDGSDRTYGDQLQEFLRTNGDERVNYLYTEHKGASGSRNVAIAKGTAPYVAFLDSDDCWLPHHLSTHVELLDAKTTVSLVHSYFTIIDSQGKPVSGSQPLVGLNDLDVSQCLVKMLKENFVGASTVVVRRTILEEVGGFDATFPSLADKELWLRLLNAGATFFYVSEATVLYRVHPGNVSKNTDLLLATRRRIIEKAEALVSNNARFVGVDWPVLKKVMVRHMYREATEVHFAQRRYAKAIKYGAPWFSGVSRRGCMLMLRSFSGLVIGYFTTVVSDVSAFIVFFGADR